MTPKDLELPEKFDSWRPGQLEIAIKIAGSQKYAFLLDGPTGCGKSLIAAAVQRIFGKNVVYLTTTKQLQDQLLHDFPYAKTLKGRSNYVCLKYPSMYPEVSAEDCNHSESNKCEQRGQCPYIKAKREALGAPLAVLNTSYFLHEINYAGAFSGQDLVIIDEVDSLEDQLMGFIEVVVTSRQLSRLNIEPPKYKTKFESWTEWARRSLIELRPRLRRMENDTRESAWSTIDVKALREKRDLKRLVTKLEFLVMEIDKTWVWYPGTDRWTFKPVWVSKYASTTLWNHCKKVLGMSATILDPKQICLNTGLALDNRRYDYLALPSPFPKECRPVYFEPCANVVSKNMDFALVRLVKAVSDIIEKHPKDKILLHSVSYKIRDYLIRNMKSNRIITHSTKDRATVLNKFKASADPLVLISPSMDRGIDLPQEECRVVIIAKVPYADLGDTQVSQRIYGSKDGNRWYAHKTISTIVQMAGRGVRSEDDYAAMYILDEQFRRLYDDHREIFPKWFKEAVIM